MPNYYLQEIARWEGEGGSHEEPRPAAGRVPHRGKSSSADEETSRGPDSAALLRHRCAVSGGRNSLSGRK
jgi:hypothetical protein